MFFHFSKVTVLRGIVLIRHLSSKPEVVEFSNNSIEHKITGGSVDLWNCHGDLKYKGDMWSYVIHYYSSYTDFVFPLNDGEYIGVRNDRSMLNDTESLSWSKNDFNQELNRLKKYTVKVFRMNQVEFDQSDLHRLQEAKTVVLKFKLKFSKENSKALMRGDGFHGTDSDNSFSGDFGPDSEESLMHHTDNEISSKLLVMQLKL